MFQDKEPEDVVEKDGVEIGSEDDEIEVRGKGGNKCDKRESTEEGDGDEGDENEREIEGDFENIRVSLKYSRHFNALSC